MRQILGTRKAVLSVSPVARADFVSRGKRNVMFSELTYLVFL